MYFLWAHTHVFYVFYVFYVFLIGMYKYVLTSDAKFVVLENVVQLLKHGIFQEIKDTLVSMGYTFQHQVLNSKDFGLRQERKRVYMYAWKPSN